ncbi:Inactive serine/threonine-protein kinase TEX14 [Taenia solium]|eukprot:TsM_000512800 transcript=TsM_000512800 gene=TsM_000512800
MVWNHTPVSVRSVLDELSGLVSRNPKLFEHSRHHVYMEIMWLRLGLNAPTLFTANQHFQHSQLSTRDRLTVLRQIIEALIHLKGLGIVHTTVSSYSIYLADPDHAKLANFEHALPWREWCEGRGKRIPETRLSEEEIIHLGAWLAPEVVLLSRSPGPKVESEAQIVSLRAKSGNNGDSAYHSIFGIGDAGCGIYCTLTPATDTFGVARVMQELFEPHCVHRFCRSIPTTSKKKLLGVLEEAEGRKLHFYLRPAIKKALRHDFTARGEIEDLYIAIVRTFRELCNKRDPLQLRGQTSVKRWCDGNSILTNTTTTSSPSEDSNSEGTLFHPGNQPSESEKENQIGVPQEEGHSISACDLSGPKQ